MTSSRTRFVEVEGVRIHAVLGGVPPHATRRRAIVALHGFTGAIESMADVAGRLGARWPVLSVDLVGHGRSDAPAELEPYRMERCGAQVRAAWQAFGLERPHLLGYSMGGRLALSVAAEDPDAVTSLLGVGASGGLADVAARAARVRADEALAHRILSEGLEAFVDRWMALPIFASQARLGRRALEQARAQRLANRPHGLANSLRGMGSGAQSPVHARLPGLTRPVALAAGEEDAKFLAIAEQLAGQLPDAEVLRVPRAGHAAHLENPEAFCALADGFFASHDASDSASSGNPDEDLERESLQPGRPSAAST